MSIPWALAVPVIIFLAIIVPLWITFHYITVWTRLRAEKKAGVGGGGDLAALSKVAERLEQRLDSLETILDTDAPNWRQK